MRVGDARAAVLVVDDEEDLREMMAFALGREGFDVVTANGGLAAVEAARARRFDLAVTDLKMPGMDGIETITALKALDPDLEIVVATGYATVDTAVACMKQGAYDYILKPFNITELRMLLERAQERRHLNDAAQLFASCRELLGTLRSRDVPGVVARTAAHLLAPGRVGVAVYGSDGALRPLRWEGGPDVMPDDVMFSLAAAVTTQRSPVRLGTGEALHVCGADTGTAIAVPLDASGRPLGVLAMDRPAGAPVFSGRDLARATMLGNQVALALENARLFGELEASIGELMRTRDRLVAREKLATLGSVSHGVAHEIGNALSVLVMSLDDASAIVDRVAGLVGWAQARGADRLSSADARATAAEILRRANEGEPGQRVADFAETAAEMDGAVKRIIGLVDDFRHLADPRPSGVEQPMRLASIVDEIVRAVPPGAKVLRDRVVDADALVFLPDVRSALLQLVAWVHRRDSAVMRLGAGTHEGAPALALSVPALSIPAEDAAGLFDPAMQGDATSGGRIRFELGLVLANHLASRSGARIRVESGAGGGAVFHLILRTTSTK